MKILCSTYLFILFLFCGGEKNLIQDDLLKIRVVNNTIYRVSDLSLYRTGFPDIEPKDTTEYKSFNLENLRIEAMMYGTIGGIKIVHYLDEPKQPGNYTYVIDSVNIQAIRTYISLHEDF